jgi:hypothetical protein
VVTQCEVIITVHSKENKAGDVLVTLMCLRETIVAVEKQLVTYLFVCVCVCVRARARGRAHV